MRKIIKVLLLLCFIGFSCKSDQEDGPAGNKDILQVISANVGSTVLSDDNKVTGVETDKPLVISFSAKLDTSTIKESISIRDSSGTPVTYNTSFLDEQATASLNPGQDLTYLADYSLEINDNLKGYHGETFSGVTFEFQTENGILSMDSIQINGRNFNTNQQLKDIEFDLKIDAWFSDSLNESKLGDYFLILGPSSPVQFEVSLSEAGRKVSISNLQPLEYYTKYSFIIDNNLISENNFTFEGFRKPFFTQIDSSFKFPEIPDDELLNLVQRQTFKYFWDFGHPVSGLSRERNTSGETVTIGGSGFGVMSFIVGVERGFITRSDAVARWRKIVDFLKTADRFHGVWPHWMNGSTGKTIPFSADDDGGDIVETSFMIHGLLTVRQYLNASVQEEQELIDDINQLWQEVEWDWYTQGENSITWHWSPNFGFVKNHKVRGWNEALIVYILAVSSPAHPVEPVVYHEGWARNGGMINGNFYYDIQLPLGPGYGGPLFFEHYSFLGLDPRKL
ncbi:MAG: Ig-like domain-containing protein, partial [Cyclobacteriaceae bacterium]|nr:Ig-like domain-containing protein [Cyclobacteriaceae bacterium]